MDWSHTITLGLAIVGATWAVRSKLSDIQVALEGHIARAEEKHRDHEARIVKLEEYRARR